MKFYSIDLEAGTISLIQEPKTLNQLKRIVGVAIGRWLMSGLDLPDYRATDGVSETEAALDF